MIWQSAPQVGYKALLVNARSGSGSQAREGCVTLRSLNPEHSKSRCKFSRKMPLSSWMMEERILLSSSWSLVDSSAEEHSCVASVLESILSSSRETWQVAFALSLFLSVVFELFILLSKSLTQFWVSTPTQTT